MSEHETPAETIRRAVEQARDDARVDDGVAAALAAADLLEAIAAHPFFPMARDETRQGPTTDVHRAALRLARTYLGETT